MKIIKNPAKVGFFVLFGKTFGQPYWRRGLNQYDSLVKKVMVDWALYG
jgi:hypothetical protein